MKNVLTIAGSDSCGGAGIQADLKTFSANGVYGMSVITAVTAQNTIGVYAVQDITGDIVKAQLDAVFSDIQVDAVKIGMVSKAETIHAIHERLLYYKPRNLVVDPVMISKSGFALLQPEACHALIEKLLPMAMLVTPNIPEAEAILEKCGTGKYKIKTVEQMESAVKELHRLGSRNILLKGGHAEGADEAIDVFFDGNEITRFLSEKIMTKNTHGTGCTLSSAIAAKLALDMPIKAAIEAAKNYITIAIRHSLELGAGVGPTNHFYELYKRGGMHYE